MAVIAQPPVRTVMIGPFPPPVHGMATVNAAVRDALASRARPPEVLDTAARQLGRGPVVRLRRLARTARLLWRFATLPESGGANAYISVSGGFGKIYEALFVTIARRRGMELVLHHHSFAYLRSRDRLTRLLVCCAGGRAIHVVQCEQMAERLRLLYGVSEVVAISNAAILPRILFGSRRRRDRLRRIGYLSNISPEKGIFVFLDLACEIDRAGFDLDIVIAGPCVDDRTRNKLTRQLGTLRRASWVGPLYGEEKDGFLDGLDVLVFPTLYADETEGLVVLEALARGIPVLAYGRGCIPSLVDESCGLAVPVDQPFVGPALTRLRDWHRSPERLERASVAAAERFERIRTRSLPRFAALLDRLAPGAGSSADPAP